MALRLPLKILEQYRQILIVGLRPDPFALFAHLLEQKMLLVFLTSQRRTSPHTGHIFGFASYFDLALLDLALLF